MNRIPFFLTPHQRYDASQRVSHNPFQSGACPKAGEAVEVLEGLLCFHRPIPYSLQPESVNFQRTFTVSKQLKMTHTKTGRPLLIMIRS